MDQVTEFKMAIDATFNSILTEIQLSNLNFAMHLTPFAAYITLKRTTHTDIHGTPSFPSPPLCMSLQKASQDLAAAQVEISHLKAALSDSVQKCANLNSVNASLLCKIEEVDAKLAQCEEMKDNLLGKVHEKDKEVSKLLTLKKDVDEMLKLQKTEFSEYIAKTDDKLK